MPTIPPAIMGFIFGAIGGWLTHFFTSRRDKTNRIRSAKDKFAVFIAKFKISVPSEGFLDFYKSTKNGVRDEVVTLKVILTNPQKTSNLDAIWNDYQAIENQNLNNESDEFNSLQGEAYAQEGKPVPRNPVSDFHACMDRFLDLAK
ncbi:MAG TPA: hypothetical protein VE344_02035 [Methylomirabilota bacterium]|nr:hypothetical protein [Methylomirabilota bacterium]